jgi:hypothetical protein
MAWLDKVMDRLTARRTKIVGAGHGPDDFQPPTGSSELSEELEADYGADTPAAEPPDDAESVPDGPESPAG